MNHEEAENFAKKCTIGIVICILIILLTVITWDGTGEAPGDNPICILAAVMIPILLMAGAMAGEKANMDSMSRIGSSSGDYVTANSFGGKSCPKCGSKMEPFMIAGGASMTVGGPNSGQITNFGSEEGHECTNCGYEEMD
tara:strand:- start:120 stop:539 length:420 start_codon:yes stop_codon:yes gene_type:complete